MKLLSIEGNTQHLDGGSMFGNVPKELWKQWLIPDGKNRIPLACRALLYQTDSGKNILFETGIGAFFDPKMRERYGVEPEHRLIQNLAKHGLREEDIDAIVLSHLHFDHAGGLLSAFEEGPTRLLFPKAKYYLGKEHWNRAKKPHLRERASFIPPLNALLEKCPRLILIEQNHHSDLGQEITFRFSHGHTVGLMLAQIQTPTQKIIFASDLIPGLAWVHLPICMGYDRYPELLINEKKDLYEELNPLTDTLFFTHDPFVSQAIIRQEPTGRYWGDPVKR